MKDLKSRLEEVVEHQPEIETIELHKTSNYMRLVESIKACVEPPNVGDFLVFGTGEPAKCSDITAAIIHECKLNNPKAVICGIGDRIEPLHLDVDDIVTITDVEPVQEESIAAIKARRKGMSELDSTLVISKAYTQQYDDLVRFESKPINKSDRPVGGRKHKAKHKYGNRYHR